MPASRSQLVVTLGPASLAVADALARAGADCFRLNGSHMTAPQLVGAVERIRQRLPQMPITVDLQGAKMRLGQFSPRELKQDEPVHLALTPDTPEQLPLPHPELFRSVQAGDTLSFDDDRVRMRVLAVSQTKLEALPLHHALLRPRKGVNVLEHPVQLDDLTAADIAHVEACCGFGALSFACSFVSTGDEAEWIRRRAPGHAIIGKVERAEAVQNIERIAEHVDELWICRGDLGAQLGLTNLARFVHRFDPKGARVPVLMAGQVLEHLTEHAEPTRSEVCHLHDLVLRGYAGIVLSDETAVGNNPEHAARTARTLLDSLS